MRSRGCLLLFILYFYGFKVFGFENLAAIQTLYVVDPVSSGNDLGSVMVTSDLHNPTL